MGEEMAAKKIVVEYSDGTREESDKGIMVTLDPSEENSDELKVMMTMVNVSGAEFQDFILAVIELASELLNNREVEA